MGVALAAACIAAAPAAAAHYEDGLAAYQRNDFAKSLKTLRPLAEKGDARAQYLLGRQYQFGQGVKADRAEAFYWYRRAEAKGHLEAKLFRQLLEKRWNISAADRARAERKLAAANAPKPPAHTHTATLREKTKPVAKTADRAKSEPVKPKIETARAKPADPPKPAAAPAKTETARAKPPAKPAVVAARSTPAAAETPPAVLRGRNEAARPAPRPPLRDVEDDDDSAAGAPPTDDPPPAETRTPIAPPPSADYAAPRGYPPAYAPSAPYYNPVPAPYYAPAAPPRWRASVHYGPRPYYRPGWGYRPYRGYVHPGWRGAGWRGFPGAFRGRGR